MTCRYRKFWEVSHVGQTDDTDDTDQSDHTDHTDHTDPNLPLWYVMQDLHSTDPTQEKRPR